MKISVLIPAFNAAPYIGAALDSVRAQTHHDWEVIVVEDGSRDATEEILRGFAKTCAQTILYHNLGENRGVGTVRNRLLELATGDAVAFLDADDTWQPAHLANAAAHLEQGADLVVSGVRTFDLVSQLPLEEIPAPRELVRDPVFTLFERSAIITSSCVVLKRALAQRTGVFDASLRIGEDRDYWLRAALAGAKFAVTDEFTCNYAKHLSSSMARTFVVAQHVTRFYEKYAELTVVPARLRRRLLAESLIVLGRLLRERDRRQSAECLWRAWRYDPFNPRIPAHLAFTGWRSVSPIAHAA
jgi:glycosyltransferase involved in cell wall biosynthesis